MPAPTFNLPVFGSAPNQYTNEESLESAMNATLLSLWNGVSAASGKSFRSRADAVAFGQDELPFGLAVVVTLEGGVITWRGPFQSADDPLFGTAPFWGVLARADVASALRDTGVMTLEAVGGTADAITASLPLAAKRNGVLATSSTSIVEIIPTATNTGTVEPTLAIDGGTAALIRSETGAALTAGQLEAGRSYLLRRRGALWRVISGASFADLTTARTERIAVDAQTGAIMLDNIGGSGDAITGEVPSILKTYGLSAANIRNVQFTVLSANTGRPTLNIDSQGPVQVWDQNNTDLPAGTLVPGVLYQAVKASNRWRVQAIARRVDLEAQGATIVSQSGAVTLTVGGTANAITGALPVGIAVTPPSVAFVALAPNTGGVTLQVGSDAGRSLRTLTGATLAPGQIEAGRLYVARLIANQWWLAGDLVRADLNAEAAARAAGDVSVLTTVEQRFGVSTLGRGDRAVIASIAGVPVLAAGEDGRLRFEVDDWTKDKLFEGYEPGGSGDGVSFLSPDVLGNIDGWNVWESDDRLMFTGQIWGPSARSYLKRAGEDPWADGPTRARVILVYGDGLANATSTQPPDRICHIAAMADGFGQEGLNGVSTTALATGIVRAGAGIGATMADLWLSMKGGALPWVGVRSEAVEGASLTQLATGQPRANLLRAVSQFDRAFAFYGRSQQVDAVTLLHGGDLDNAAYTAELLALCDNILSDTGAAAIVTFAPAGTSVAGGQAAVRAAPDAIDLRGTIPLILASPLYWCDIRAGTLATPTPAHMTMLAELAAHALLAGEYWMPPKAFHASRSASVINIDFDVMPGHNLTVPTFGLTWSGAGTITAMDVVTDPATELMTRLRVTLSAAGAGTISYAMQPTGGDPTKFAGRGDLRDNWSAPSVTGGTLRRYAFPFTFEV